MSLFPPVHAERIAPGSFQQPVPIPAAFPGEPPFVTVCFNRDWLTYILGCLFQLTLSTTWLVNSQDELNTVLGRANNLILIFQNALEGCQTQNPGFAGAVGSEDFMLRQNPDNPCELQTSVDGITWCTWADISKCISNKQPAQGATQPPAGGGCTTFHGEVSIGDMWMLPNNVSTGDVVTVSHANGLWCSPLDLFIPRCPDGNLWFEIACVEGSGHTEPGDPAPTINHDSLIAYDGTHYYDCGAASDNTPVVITIGAGISQKNLFFMCNTPDTSGTGNVVFDVEYCNNAVPSWTHTLDFTVSPQGFSVFVGPSAGVWVAGVGWQTTIVSGHSDVEIKRPLASTNFTDVLMKWTYGGSGSGGSSAAGFWYSPDETGTLYDTTDITAGHFENFANVTGNGLTLALNTNAGDTTVQTLTSLLVSGTGPDPFTGP